jgi:regulator of protease activity HflC (stomatin/prohibitin superfamily)
VFVCAGLYLLPPNETAVVTLFGRYVGTDRGEGLRWAFPLYRKRKLTVRARNLNMSTLKVNDKRGNPVELAAAVVWRVRDTAQALFEVDDFERYVSVQAEAALRHLAAQYAYDEGEDLAPGETTLRGGAAEVAHALSAELTARFEAAGVETLDAKLTHLAYAPEIAQVMLRRQQAQAIISARARIVHGAVTMVEDALKGLAEREIVELDAERKASMVSNLLVVLCSDRDAQPIINAGTLYN